MTQYNFENIDPYVDTGVDLAADLNGWKDAVQSCHKGNTRPAYAVAGTLWINDTANPWKVNVYNGTVDVEIGTMSATTNLFVPTGAGSFRWIYTASTTQTLPVASAGSLIGIAAGGITLTLPARSGLQSGSKFFIKNITGTSASTVLPPADDLFIAARGVTLSTISLGVGDEVCITVFGNTWVASGPAVAKYQAVFGSSLSDSGYQKLPSGLIIQWGVSPTISMTAGAQQTISATLPIAFPNTHLFTTYCLRACSVTNQGVSMSLQSLSTTELALFLNSSSTQTVQFSYASYGY